jgi:large subunit ribosomal protein L5
MEKIVINMGVSASLEKSALDDAAKDLALITGRKPVINKARKSVANFKLRKGQPIGCRVTLRRTRCTSFSTAWWRRPCRASAISGASPPPVVRRTRQLLAGVADQTIFPEIDLDKIKRTRGWTSPS